MFTSELLLSLPSSHFNSSLRINLACYKLSWNGAVVGDLAGCCTTDSACEEASDVTATCSTTVSETLGRASHFLDHYYNIFTSDTYLVCALPQRIQQAHPLLAVLKKTSALVGTTCYTLQVLQKKIAVRLVRLFPLDWVLKSLLKMLRGPLTKQMIAC